MSAQDIFNQAASDIFTALDGIETSVTYVSTGVNLYSTTTGVVAKDEAEYTVSFIFNDNMKRRNQNTKIQSVYSEAIIPVADLAVTPKVNDVIERGDETWYVEEVGTDAANCLWILVIRYP